MRVARPLVRYFRHAGVVLVSLISFGMPICSAEIPGYPNSIFDYDVREVAMLPPYCKYTQVFRHRVPGGDNMREIERWYTVMGGTMDTGPFHAMHHYCWGLMKTNRALILSRTRQDRQFYLTDSLYEFDWVIQRVPQDFPLLPEFHTKKGENLLHLGLMVQGMRELQRAIELKPDYWPPYVAASDYHKKINDLSKARAWLEKGLSAVPDTKALQHRLAELGGSGPQKSAPPARAETRSPPQDNAALPPATPKMPDPTTEP